MTLQPQPSGASERAILVSRLSGDPVQQPALRAGDGDRDVVRDVLNHAFAQGRLTREEHLERLDQVTSARTLGDLYTLAQDVVTDRPAAAVEPVGVTAPAVRDRSPRSAALVRAGQSWLFVTIITNVIWVLTGFGGGYYWPIWPMFGLAIPVLAALVFGGGGRRGPDEGPSRPELH